MSYDLLQPLDDYWRGFCDAYAWIYEEMFGLGGIPQSYLDANPEYKRGFEAGRDAYLKADEAMRKRAQGG